MLSSLIASPPDFKSSVMPGPLMTSSQFMDDQQYVNIQDVPFCFSDSSPISSRILNFKDYWKLFNSNHSPTLQHSDNLLIGLKTDDPDNSVMDFKDCFTHPVSPQSDGSFSGHSTDSERCTPAHSICSLSPEHSMDGIEDIDLSLNLSISDELLCCLDTTRDWNEAMSSNSVSTNEHSISNIHSIKRSLSNGLTNQDFNPISSADFSSAECLSSLFIKQELENELPGDIALNWGDIMQTRASETSTYPSRSSAFLNAFNSNGQLSDEFLNHHEEPNFTLSKYDCSVSPYDPFLSAGMKLDSNSDSKMLSYSGAFSTQKYSDKSPLINNWIQSQKGCMDMSEHNGSNKSNEDELLHVKTNAVAYNKIVKSEPVDTCEITNEFIDSVLGSKELKLPKNTPGVTEGTTDLTEDMPALIEDMSDLTDFPDLTTGIPELPADIPALSSNIPDLSKDVPVLPKNILVLPKNIPDSQREIPGSQRDILDDMSIYITSSPSEAVKCDHCYAKSELSDTPVKLEIDVIQDYSEELIQAQTPAKRRPGRPRKVVAVPTEYHTKVMAPKATNLKRHKRSLPPSTKKVKFQSGSSVRTDRREQHNKAERLRRYAIKESMFIVASKCPEYIFYATQSALQSSKSSRCEEIENNFTVEVLRKIDEIVKKTELEQKRCKYKKAANYSKMVMLLGVTYFVSNLEKQLKRKEHILKVRESVMRNSVHRPAKRTKKC